MMYREIIQQILEQDPRYKAAAYDFVREGLDYTMQQLEKPEQGPDRHVTGQELSQGLKEFALKQFGPMARTVLAHWGIRRTEDLGEIVFNLVEVELLGKTDDDNRNDFQDVYSFEEAFTQPYLAEAGEGHP